MSQAKEDIKNRLRIVGLKKHDRPDYKEDSTTGFVRIGKKNDYPEKLIDLYNSSSVHRAIIDGKCDYIVGSGIEIDTSDLDTKSKAIMEQSVRKVNPDEDFNSFILKVCKDWKVFGRFAIEVIPSNSGKNIYKYHVPVSGVRTNKDKSRFAYSPDWKNINTDTPENREKGYKEWNAYDPETIKGEAQLFYYADYDLTNDYYSLPEYQSTISWIEIDSDISQYFYSLVKNNFVAGYILNVPQGTPSSELADEFEREFKRKFTGSENAGEIMIVFTEEGSSGVTITPINTNELDAQYERLSKDTNSNIFTGHRVTSPGLFGVETDQPFGNRTEIREKAEFFQNSYVTINQKRLEKPINYLMGTGGRITFKKMEPISNEWSEATLSAVMTNDEIRESAGLPKLSNSSEFSSDKTVDLAIELFSRMGEPSERFDCVFSKPVIYDGENPIIDEDEFRLSFQTPDDLSSLERSILEILKESPSSTIEDMADMLNSTPKAVGDALASLQRAGTIEINEITDQGEVEIERTLSPEADQEIGAVEFEVRYRYITRPDVPSAKSGSRDFCRRLMALNRVYTRAEIDQISAITGRNVWRMRGGWYHNPNTDVNTPFCRHIWQSELVRKNN